MIIQNYKAITMKKKKLNLKSQQINKAGQKSVNGGMLVAVNECRGAVSFSPDGTCPPGQRLIGHCICCAD